MLIGSAWPSRGLGAGRSAFPFGAVRVGGDPGPVGVLVQFPAVLVQQPVVESTQQATVGDPRRTTVGSFVEVMDVAVLGPPATSGEHAVVVAGGDGTTLSLRESLGGVVGVEHPVLAGEERGDQRGVAEELLGRAAGEVPALAVEHEVVEVRDVSGSGQRAQVDVRIDGCAGSGPDLADLPTTLLLGRPADLPSQEFEMIRLTDDFESGWDRKEGDRGRD